MDHHAELRRVLMGNSDYLWYLGQSGAEWNAEMCHQYVGMNGAPQPSFPAAFA